MLSILPIAMLQNLEVYCREMFSLSFPNSRLAFIRRQANSSAHTLARETVSLASPTNYYVIPNCIETL